MGIALTADSRLGGLDLPPRDILATVPELAAVTDAYREALGLYRELSQAATRDQVALAEAAQRDAEAWADAKQRGEDIPGPTHVREAEDRIRDAQHRVAGAKVVLERSEQAVREAFDSHGDQLLALVEADKAQDVRELHDAVDTAAECTERIAGRDAVLRMKRTGRFIASVKPTAYVGQLPQGVGVDAALAVLRDFAKPAPVTEPAETPGSFLRSA
jgi:hypothetical protein